MNHIDKINARFRALMTSRSGMKPVFVLFDDLSVSIAIAVAGLGHEIAIAPLDRAKTTLCAHVMKSTSQNIEVMPTSFDVSNLPTAMSKYSLVAMIGRSVHRSLYRQINEFAMGFQVPFLTGFVDSDTSYRLGPLVAPGIGACYECCDRRMYSNHPNYELQQDIDLLYQRNSGHSWEGRLAAYDGYYLSAIVIELDRVLTAASPRSLSSLLLLNPLRQQDGCVLINRLEYCSVCASTNAQAGDQPLAEFVKGLKTTQASSGDRIGAAA